MRLLNVTFMVSTSESNLDLFYLTVSKWQNSVKRHPLLMPKLSTNDPSVYTCRVFCRKLFFYSLQCHIIPFLLLLMFLFYILLYVKMYIVSPHVTLSSTSEFLNSKFLLSDGNTIFLAKILLSST